MIPVIFADQSCEVAWCGKTAIRNYTSPALFGFPVFNDATTIDISSLFSGPVLLPWNAAGYLGMLSGTEQNRACPRDASYKGGLYTTWTEESKVETSEGESATYTQSFSINTGTGLVTGDVSSYPTESAKIPPAYDPAEYRVHVPPGAVVGDEWTEVYSNVGTEVQPWVFPKKPLAPSATFTLTYSASPSVLTWEFASSKYCETVTLSYRLELDGPHIINDVRSDGRTVTYTITHTVTLSGDNGRSAWESAARAALAAKPWTYGAWKNRTPTVNSVSSADLIGGTTQNYMTGEQLIMLQGQIQVNLPHSYVLKRNGVITGTGSHSEFCKSWIYTADDYAQITLTPLPPE